MQAEGARFVLWVAEELQSAPERRAGEERCLPGLCAGGGGRSDADRSPLLPQWAARGEGPSLPPPSPGPPPPDASPLSLQGGAEGGWASDRSGGPAGASTRPGAGEARPGAGAARARGGRKRGRRSPSPEEARAAAAVAVAGGLARPASGSPAGPAVAAEWRPAARRQRRQGHGGCGGVRG